MNGITTVKKNRGSIFTFSFSKNKPHQQKKNESSLANDRIKKNVSNFENRTTDEYGRNIEHIMNQWFGIRDVPGPLQTIQMAEK